MNPDTEARAKPRLDLAAGVRFRRIAGRIFREPLTHFALIGLVLFFGVGVVKAARQPVIRIDSEELSQLIIYWELQMQRPPTQDEVKGIVRERIDEEILLREALRLGLDRNDMIIRRRLAQKMSFATEDLAEAVEPTDAELRTLYNAHPGDYAAPPRMTLRHIFFSDDRAAGDARAAATRALVQLQQGRTDIAGDPFVMASTFADISPEALDKDFGPEFATAAIAARLGDWTGPVRSAYGWHDLRIEARSPAQVAPFADVRTKVREAWLAQRREAMNAASLAKLRKRYRIEITDAEARG